MHKTPLHKPFPFDLILGDGVLSCHKLLRTIPDKRMVIAGRWQNRPVVAKIFISSFFRAWYNFTREIKGTRAFFSQNMLTPTILYAGRLPDSGHFIILYEYLLNPIDFQVRFERTTLRIEKLSLLRELLHAIATQHNLGIFQIDIHLKNFLYSRDQLYCIDMSGVRIEKKPLNLKRSLRFLALLLTESSLKKDFEAETIEYYLKLRDFPNIPQILEQIAQEKINWLKRREKEICSKLYRTSSHIISEKSPHQYWVCQKQYLTDTLRTLLRAPEFLFSSPNVEVLKAGNTATVAKIEIGEQCFLVKRYNIKNFRHRIKLTLSKTRAKKSWENAHRLIFRGIPTPLPVAIVETFKGKLQGTSYFITEYFSGITAMNYFTSKMDTDNKHVVMQSVAKTLARLAQEKICHRDLKASNILIKENDISLVDLDAMKFYRNENHFNRRFKKDIERFMRNWQEKPVVKRLFEHQLEKQMTYKKNNHSTQSRFILFFARGFESGSIPFAPGTMGTLVSIPFYLLFQTFSLTFYAFILILTFIVGVWLCDKAAKLLDSPDPSSVVWDEMVGFWLTLFAVPFSWLHLVIGFLLFRFFDILKPWPIHWAEKKIPGGLGIMLDDVLAAIYANIGLQLIAHFI